MSIQSSYPTTPDLQGQGFPPLVDAEVSIGFEFQSYDTARGLLPSVAALSVDAIFIDGYPDWTQPGKIQLIFADALLPHPLNPRKTTDREALATLAESLRAGGMHTPLDICQKSAEAPNQALVLSGHRRLWTSKMVGAELIPCRLDPRGVLNEIEQREALIRYNEGQEKPAPIDRAQSVLDMMVASDLNQAQTAARLGMNQATVSRLLKLLTLPDVVKEMANTGEINESVAFELTRIKDNPQRQIDLALEAKERGYSAAKVHRMAAKPKVKLPTRTQARTSEQTLNERTVFVEDGSSRVKLTFTSTKVAMTDEAVSAAVQQVVNRIPVDISIDETQPTNPPAGSVNPTDTVTPSSQFLAPQVPATSDTQKPASAVETSEVGTASDHAPLPVQDSRPAPAQPDSVTPAPPDTDDRFGLKGQASYEFPIVSGYRSGAAESVAAIFTDGYPDWSRTDEIQLVFRSALAPHPWNPRKQISTEAMRETVLSIKASGIHTPLKISQHPDNPQKALILGGHRRTWVAFKLDLELVPVKLDPRGVLSEVQVRETLINDNEGQVKPAPIDRARSFSDYLSASGYPLPEAARRVNVSEVEFGKALSLLKLPEPVQVMINNGDLSVTAGVTLLSHRGGDQAIIALAHRVLAHNIPQAVLTKMVRRSQVDLTGLATTDTKAGTELHNVVGGNNRIHVVVSSENGNLPSGEALATLISSGINSLGTDSDSAVRAPSAPVLPDVQTIALDGFARKDPAVFGKGLKRFLPELVTESAQGFAIAPATARILTLEFTNKDLKKLGFTSEDVTTYHITRLLGASARDTSSDKVTIAAVTEYLVACLDALDQLPASKKLLTENDVERLNLDTGHYSGAPKEVLRKELLDRLKRLPEIFEVRLAPLATLKEIEQSAAVPESATITFSPQDLVAAGIGMSNKFHWHYRRWLADTKRIPYSGTIEQRGLRFDDLHGYFTHCAKVILEHTGGRAERTIGVKQLRAAFISYSGDIGAESARRFSSQEVFKEIRDSLETLNNLFSSRSALQNSNETDA